jgi:cysteinyl-tRNA synthetase
MLYLRAHYRSPIEYSDELLSEAAESLDRLDRFRERATPGEPEGAALDHFREAMDDDFGTPQAISVLFDLVRDGNRLLDDGEDASSLAGAVETIVSVLGLDDASEGANVSHTLTDAEVDVLVTERNQARSERRFDDADAIRDSLDDQGVSLEDGPNGTRWLRK